MPTRRHFIGRTAGALAGMAVAGAGGGVAAGVAAQPAGGGTRRRVVVGGRRVTTVDVHAHCEIPGVREMMGAGPSPNHPFPWTGIPDDARVPRFDVVDHVLDTPGLSDADRIAILGGNAAALFGISV